MVLSCLPWLYLYFVMPVQADGPEDYKAKYKTLKRKLKLLIYENECFQEELRKAQRALLRVRRDKSFLLDRLLQYQRGPDSSSDSDQTEESDTETDTKIEAKSCRKRLSMEGSTIGSSNSQGSLSKPPSKKKKSSSNSSNSTTTSVSKSSKQSGKQIPLGTAIVGSNSGNSSIQAASSSSGISTSTNSTNSPSSTPTVRKLTSSHMLPGSAAVLSARRHVTGSGASGTHTNDGQLSREEVERRLAARQPMNDFTTTTVSLTLPNQLFSDNIMEGYAKTKSQPTGDWLIQKHL
nr:dentin sialophosphoprotein-like isoform X2 [Cherax quadricarinatus]